MKMIKTDLFKGIIVSLVLLAIILVTLEIVSRLLTQSDTVFNMNIGAYAEYHPTRGRQLKAGYNSGDIKINSHGILGPEFEINKSPKTVRILTIGNSVTFSPPRRNYSRVIDEKLKTYFPSKNIEVICCAVPGYNSSKALDWYEEFLHKLDPDIAIIELGWNDMYERHPFGMKFKNESIGYRQRTLIGSLMDKLYFLRIPYYFQDRIEKRRKHIDLSPLTLKEKDVLDAFIPTDYKNNLTSLIEKLKNQGTTVYLIGLPGLMTYSPTDDELKRMHFGYGMNKKLAVLQAIYSKYFAVLEEVSINTQTLIIDLREIIKTEEKRKIFTDSMHINEEGSEQFGNFITEFIKPKVELLLRKDEK